MSDLGHSLRLLKKDPAFTVVALVTLAVGIGANVAIFGIINAVLLRRLPYAQPEGILEVSERQLRPPAGRAVSFITNETFDAWRDRSQTLEQIAGYLDRSYTVTGLDEPIRLHGAAVTPSLFDVLRARPVLGRVFEPREGRPGADRVALVSERTRDRLFGRDPHIVGRFITLDGQPHEVVGVMPAAFQFPAPDTELWTPLATTPPIQRPNMRFIMAFSALARLRPGVTLEQAETEGTMLLRELERERPRPGPPGGDAPPPQVRLIPLQEAMVAEVRPALLVLWAAVGFVLLVTCANLANLLLARGAARRRELAVRSALGADRARLVRQLLFESLVLALAGGLIGILVARWFHAALPSMVPPEIPRIDEVALDGPALGFALVLSVATGLIFGSLPALATARLDLVRSLNATSGRTPAGLGRFGRGARGLLAVAEIASAILLLIGAGLLIRSFVELVDRDPGYEPGNVITARLMFPTVASGPLAPEDVAKTAQARAPVLSDLLARVSATAGVEHAGVVSFLPLSQGEARIVIRIEGRPPPNDPAEVPAARPQIASPGYFEALGIPLVQGRYLSDEDRATSPPVAVVNQAFARAFFPGEAAVSRRLQLGREALFEVVGVVGDVRHAGPRSDPQPEFYVTFRQLEHFPLLAPSLFLVAKTVGDPVAIAPLLRQAVRESDPGVPLDDVMTMDARLSASVAEPRFYAVVLALFALVALVLAATGIYGVLSHTVAQRRMELGVRVALGARSGQVVAMVLRQGLALVAAGVVSGLAAAFAASRTLASLLFGVTPTDPTTFITVPLLLVVVGLLACYIPARRATRVDPMEALRAQ